MSAPSKKSRASTPRAAATSFQSRDVMMLLAALGLAVLMMVNSGFRRGVELMPWPDGLEYAAVALNLDQGRGDVLHFGGYSYPSRYTEGYPLLLAAAYPLVGHDVAHLVDATLALALFAIVALYLLTFELFDRASGFIASLILAVSPVFITYSTLVLSDVPTLAITLLAALVLARATFDEEASRPERGRLLAYWAIFGFLAGFTVMIRPTNAVMLIGVAAALVAVAPAGMKSREAAALLIAFAAGFAPMPLWQARENAIHLGSAFASGYAYWVPEVYGAFSRIFNPAYLFGPTLPRNPGGNLPIYVLSLCGLDGILNSPGAPSFFLYPFAAAAFAAIGAASVSRAAPSRATRRIVVFGLGFLASLLVLYLFYVFTEVAFLLPGCFILFALAGNGATLANRRLVDLWSRRRLSTRERSLVAGVLILDLLLVASVFGELAGRLSVWPRDSEVVPALRTLDKRLEPGATVVSNISLQFLELYIPSADRNFVGLHSFEPGADFTDYHLARLYEKKSHGWPGRVPPVLFDGSVMIAATADSLASQARAGKPVYLLLWTPSSDDYQEVLGQEVSQIGERFSLDEVARPSPLVLYRLQPRR